MTFATIRRLQALTLTINGTVATPFPNSIGVLVRLRFQPFLLHSRLHAGCV